MPTETPTPSPPNADQGLRCPQCDYNLTGLPDNICPECGTVIDWTLANAVRDAVVADAKAKRAWWRQQWRRGLPGTLWDRWPWYLKPIAFLLTLSQVAITPWRFATSLPDHPRLFWALAFAAICLTGTLWQSTPALPVGGFWLIGAIISIMGQALCFRAISGPDGPQRYRYWLVVCCYASYPTLVEQLLGIPVFTLMPETIVGAGPQPSLASVAIFLLWWVDLCTIWWIKADSVGHIGTVLAWVSVPLFTAAVPWIVFALALATIG